MGSLISTNKTTGLKLFISLLVLTVLFNYKCLAQFTDSTNYHVKFASTGILNRTNDGDSYVLTNGLNFNVNKKKMTFNSTTAWIYGLQNNNLTNNDFSTYEDFDLFKSTHRLYYWGLLTYEKSYSLKITNRFQAGGGIAYKTVTKPNFNLVLSDGFLYETSNLEDATLGHDVYQTVRNSFRVKYKLTIKNTVVLEGVGFYQPSMLDISDYIIKGSNSLSVKLNKWLSLTASEINNTISRTKRENLLVTFGITVEKYF
ncbi:hypothetical protein QTN47_06950 [Danxiaibacter flavus]|uniref:DUF481 domain-containing protein n=1 Tax=Danxiaibacter flavus TaxID=3049108 RepID=A0ABV3ZCM5_9BACT|nr:hypothetical protein QNM32_06950 [Chitinophagaceae bacterium DXS]